MVDQVEYPMLRKKSKAATLPVAKVIGCHQRDHILQVQLAAHICVLVNHLLLQNFMGKGCRTLRDIGSTRHLYSY